MKQLIANKTPTNAMEDNLIPMINIIFLLLIFFMIAGQVSQLRNTQSVNVPDSKSEQAITPQTAQITITQDQQYFVDEQPIQLAEIDQLLTESQDKTIVNLMVDAELNAGDLDRVMRVLRQQAVQKVALFTQLPTKATP